MSLPLPVPSEAIDFTPPELWPILREEHPEGAEMPASVPKAVWDKHWIASNPDLAKTMQPPPPPPFLKSYWGKLRDRALPTRKRAAKAEEGAEPLPPVWPTRLSPRFWRRYFEKFPEGHAAPRFESGASARPWQPMGDDGVYALQGSGLCVNTERSSGRKFYRTSTGVDAWDDRGNWLGPG